MKKTLSLAYFMNFYPVLAQTFISREIKGLKNLGVNISAYSIRKPKMDVISVEDTAFVNDTFYIFPMKILPFIWANLYFILTKPSKYFKVFSFIFTQLNIKSIIRTFYHFCEAIYVAKKIAGENINHIHSHFASGPTSAAMFISILTDVSFSFTAHGSDIFLEKLLLDRKIKFAKFVITISNYNKNYLSKLVPDSLPKIFVVYSGVDPQIFLPVHKTNNIPIILSVGRLVWQKGHKYLIKACSILKENGIKFHCIIIGDGPERRKLEFLIEKYNLHGVVQLKGRMLPEQVVTYYDKADIFVLSSVSEGIPVVLMEAMAKEIPVIASRITGIPELIDHNFDGILVPPTDVNQIASNIKSLVEDDARKKKIGVNARKKILEKFDIQNNVKELKSIFEVMTI